jgi:hypothetical protein
MAMSTNGHHRTFMGPNVGNILAYSGGNTIIDIDIDTDTDTIHYR